jgi:hypothetical protein
MRRREWPPEPMGTLERNILRIGVYELEEETVPREVAINEAVVLAKRYATEEAARLVNGILGQHRREEAQLDTGRRRPRPAEELLDKLNERGTELERLAAADDVDGDSAVDLISELAELARRSRPSSRRARTSPMRQLRSSRRRRRRTSARSPSRPSSADSTTSPLLARVGRQAHPAHALLAVARRRTEQASSRRRLPAAAALELVHTFSLVHDDLPALDDDDERRGRPEHARRVRRRRRALLARDALLAERMPLALTTSR